MKAQIVLKNNALDEQKARYDALSSQFKSYKEIHIALAHSKNELSRSVGNIKLSLNDARNHSSDPNARQISRYLSNYDENSLLTDSSSHLDDSLNIDDNM